MIEARSPHPLMPLELFANRWFSATNVVTLALYFALGGSFFLLVIQLQTTLGLLAGGGRSRPLPADRRSCSCCRPAPRTSASASDPASR